MPLLRLNEHYTSIQGEGPNTGKMTQFVRFSGCNMRCPGWPCDTQHAILPELYKQDPKLDVPALMAAINNVRTLTGAAHLCITGGEPFMQDNNLLRDLVLGAVERGYTVDIFTNGSFLFPSWALGRKEVVIVMDWKLPGSGESSTKLEVRGENLMKLTPTDAVKFVVKDDVDLGYIDGLLNDHHFNPRCQVWIGRVWDGPITNHELIEFLQEHQLPWSLNVQMHKYLWPNVERGI